MKITQSFPILLDAVLKWLLQGSGVFFFFFFMFSNYARVVYVECLKSVVNFIYLTSSRTEEESRGRAAS